jgi:hypothetical protein
MSQLTLNSVIEFAIRTVQGNDVSLGLNGTCHLLFCADDIDLLDDSINTTEENTEILLQTSRDVGLEINAEKTKYISFPVIRNQDKSRKKQTDIHDEIRYRLNSGNACHHSVRNILSSRLT